MAKTNIPEDTLKQVFAQHPKAEKLFITSDGQIFTAENKAEAHVPRLEDRKIKTVVKTDLITTSQAPETPKTESILDLSLKNLEPEIEKIQDVETLVALKAEENDKGEDARKGAIELIEDRIKAINAADTEKAKNLNVVDGKQLSGDEEE